MLKVIIICRDIRAPRGTDIITLHTLPILYYALCLALWIAPQHSQDIGVLSSQH